MHTHAKGGLKQKKKVISLKYSDMTLGGVIWMQATCQRTWSPDMKQVLMSQESYKVTRKQ